MVFLDSGNSLHDRVVQAIGRRIATGRLSPGDIVDSDSELAKEFGASRTAMREAVRVLTAKGLLESRPRLGTRVKTPEHWNYLDADVLAWQQYTGNPQWRQDLIELRRLIEPSAAALAAKRADDAMRVRLRNALEEMQRSLERGMLEDVIRADIDFHTGLLDGTGNRMIASLRDAVSASLQAGLSQSLVNRAKTPVDLLILSMPVHFRVLEAIEASDEEGSRIAMEALLDHAAHDLHEMNGV